MGKAAIQTIKPKIIQTPDTKWQERGFMNSCGFFPLLYHQEVLPGSLFMPALTILCLHSPCAGGGKAASPRLWANQQTCFQKRSTQLSTEGHKLFLFVLDWNGRLILSFIRIFWGMEEISLYQMQGKSDFSKPGGDQGLNKQTVTEIKPCKCTWQIPCSENGAQEQIVLWL